MSRREWLEHKDFASWRLGLSDYGEEEEYV